MMRIDAGKRFFFSSVAKHKHCGKCNTDGRSFGGMNVIILGDFHQFPQGARPIRDALYYPSSAKIDSLGSQNGRVIYGEYNSYYIKRVSDLVWHTANFLQHLRQVR